MVDLDRHRHAVATLTRFDQSLCLKPAANADSTPAANFRSTVAP